MDPRTSQAYFSLIGTSYEEKDCWQIAKDFYSMVFGVSLGRIYDGPPQERKDTELLVKKYIEEFEKVDTPKFGDLILFNIRGLESHIGVYVGEERFIHSSKRIGCVIDLITRWEKLIVGYYTLRGNK